MQKLHSLIERPFVIPFLILIIDDLVYTYVCTCHRTRHDGHIFTCAHSEIPIGTVELEYSDGEGGFVVIELFQPESLTRGGIHHANTGRPGAGTGTRTATET